MISVGTIGTGSGGNGFFVARDDALLLIDCGFAAREVERRLEQLGRRPEMIRGLLLSHEHGDHVKGATAMSRRYRVTVHATRGTYRGVPSLRRKKVRFEELAPGQPVQIPPFGVEPFPVVHDAASPVGFLVETGGCRIAFTTDLGQVSAAVRSAWDRADVLVVESNHDLDMLRLGPYPEVLKQRVASPSGHLSNQALAGYLRLRRSRRPDRVVLTHLSEANNDPGLAVLSARTALDGASVPVSAFTQRDPVELTIS